MATARNWRKPLEMKRTNGISDSFKGYWSLRCESKTVTGFGGTEADVVWRGLCELHEKNQNLIQHPPKMYTPPDGNVVYIDCYTPDYRDLENVLQIAKAIRHLVYLRVMYYRRTAMKGNFYMYTPEEELYEIINTTWKLVNKNDVGLSNRSESVEALQLDEYSSQVDLRTGDASASEACTQNNWRSQSDMPESTEKKVLPSQVVDVKHIYLRSQDDIFEAELRINGGKWMIFTFGEMDKHDSFWVDLQPLYESGIFVKLKASTAVCDEKRRIINCYTANAKNVDEIKKAANAIREQIDYDCLMYYKPNQASVEGQYRSEGIKLIAKYMHSKKCGFYVRDECNRWTLLS